MASPAVAGTNVTNLTVGAGSFTVNLPASIAAGDLLLLFFAQHSQIDGTETATATGWTVISGFYIKDAGNVQSMHGLYRWADGAEGSTVTVTTSASNTKAAATTYRITGAENPATQVPQAGTGTTGSGAANAADPPSVGVTGGSKDILAIAVMAQQGETYTGGGAPTSYTNLITANSSTASATTTNGWIQSAQRQVTTATEDPGVFNHTSTDVWVANTIVVHPGGGDQALTGTLFTSTPTFFAGIVNDGLLFGALFATAPTFFQGAVAADTTQPLTGTLFTNAPTFFTHRIRRVTPPANLVLNEIGVIGFSALSTFVEYYRLLSPTDLIPLYSHGGLTAEVWGDPTNPQYAGAWATLDNDEPVGGFRAFWVCLGFLETYTETQAEREAWADHIFSRLMTDFPTIQYIWWSPMHTEFSINPGDGDSEDLITHDPWGTNPGGLVEWSGAGLIIGPEQSWQLTQYAYDQGYADDYGPWINLTAAETDPDGRHPSEAPADPVPNGTSHGGDIIYAFFEADAQGMIGTTLVSAPTFFLGDLTGASALTGTLFTSAPSFFAGVVAMDPALTGTLFVNTVTFNPGTVILMASQVPTSLVSNVGWTTTPTPGQSIPAYIATDDSDFITVTV